MVKRKKTANKRKKDAQSEIEILTTMFPNIKTRTASEITGRNLSLVSKILSKLRKEKNHIFKSNENPAFNETDMGAFACILSNLIPTLKIPYILNLPIDFIYDTLNKDSDDYELVTCPKGHTYIAKKGIIDSCPVCFKQSSIHPRAKWCKCSEFTEGAKLGKHRERFALLLTEASNIITLYYKSRERNDIILKYIKQFRDALVWMKLECVTVGQFDVPFFAGCHLLSVNPYLLREKFYVKILRRERRLERRVKKERMVKLSNIDDLISFTDFYIHVYESSGGLGRGTTVSYRPLQNSVAFFEAL